MGSSCHELSHLVGPRWHVQNSETQPKLLSVYRAQMASRDIRCRPEKSEHLALPIQRLQIETKTKV
jgi:hypothetical protein